jgi:hypothetical protein
MDATLQLISPNSRLVIAQLLEFGNELTNYLISRLLSKVKDDVVESLNLQLEQMQLTLHMYPEAQALKESMSSVHDLVVSLPDIKETVQRTYGIVQSLDQSRLGIWNKIQIETISMLTVDLQIKNV